MGPSDECSPRAALCSISSHDFYIPKIPFLTIELFKTTFQSLFRPQSILRYPSYMGPSHESSPMAALCLYYLPRLLHSKNSIFDDRTLQNHIPILIQTPIDTSVPIIYGAITREQPHGCSLPLLAPMTSTFQKFHF